MHPSHLSALVLLPYPLRIGIRGVSACILSLLISWCGFPDLSDADELRRDIFTHLTIEDGLPSRRTFAIEQDPHGFLWFATQAGLVRYDGYDLLVFRHEVDNPGSLPDDYLLALQIDRKGHIWTGTAGGYLVRYDSQKERFDSWHLDGSVEALAITDNNTLWALNGRALFRFDPARQEPLAVYEEPEIRISRGLQEGLAGDLWIGVIDRGLIRFRPGVGKIELHEIASQLDLYHLRHDGEYLWLSTLGQGLIRFTPSTGEVLHLRHDPEDPETPSSDLVAQTFRHGDHIWAATNRGLDLLTLDGRRLRGFRNDPSNPRSLYNDFALASFLDRSGTLWVSTGGGISRTQPDQNAFALYQYGPQGAAADLPSGNILALLEDQAGRVWVGSSTGELAYLDPTRKRAQKVPRPQDPAGGTSAIWAMLQTRDASIWIGTDQGIERYDPDADQVAHVPADLEDPAAAFQRVTSLYEDRSARLWAGTDQGLRLYQAERKNFSNPMPTVSDRVLALEQTPDGALWIGMDSDGLARRSPETEKIDRHWSGDPESPYGLSHGIVSDLHFSQRGELWIATVGGGLNRYLPEVDGFETFPPQ